ncbi:MAG TPA: tetratricopeptide repeat protein, partial [Acetobacteraceae bacterium]|nr:tetratricopeptide repeat protein [Acetobacteraceae bacterium]
VEAGDPAAALQYWQQALVRYPAFTRTSHDSLDVLIGLKRYEEAEPLMLEGMKRERHDPFFAQGYARIAEHRGDLETAIERWARVRKRYPGAPDAYIAGSRCLRAAGRLDDAEKLNATAIKRFSKDLRVWMEWAQLSEATGDLDEALSRWETVAEKYPHVICEQSIARVLEKLGRLDDVEARLRQARLRFPIDPTLAVARAELADRRGDREDAARCWGDVMRRFPRLVRGYQEAHRALLAVDRIADAEAAMVDAMDRFPTDAWPAINHASLASRRQDWTEAVTRWGWVRERWPDRAEGYLRSAEALAALGQKDEAENLRARYRERQQPAMNQGS